MSGEDWFFMAFASPLLLIGGWIQSYRVWRRKADVGTGVAWVTGQGGKAGFHAFLLPGTLGMTLAWAGIVCHRIQGAVSRPPGWLDPLVTYLLLAGLASALIGFWLWVSAWPRFLVPPHVRSKEDSSVTQARGSDLQHADRCGGSP